MTEKIRTTVIKNDFLGESYTKIDHPSGCEIYVFPKKLSSIYAILGSKYGSINNIFKIQGDSEYTEVPDGIAHFLEHKLFTNEDGSDSFERFSEYGADANAYTSFTKTAYLFSCTDRFSESLGELIDFVTHPYFTEESVNSEIGIISEEIRMYNDNPQERCFCGMLEGMYHRHSIRRNICGSVESISKITPELLYRCYEVFYQPSNLALIVCGDVSVDEIMDIANKHLPSSSDKKEIIIFNENDTEPSNVLNAITEIRMQVSKPLFSIGFKDTDIPSSPEECMKKDAAMSVLNEMLFSTSGELYNELLSAEMISPSLSYGYTINETFAYNAISGESDEPKKILEKILAHINKLRKTGLSKEDFLRGKKVMLADFVKNFDSTENIANSLFASLYDGATDTFLAFSDIISNVDFEYVNMLFETQFSEEAVTLSIVRPLDSNA